MLGYNLWFASHFLIEGSFKLPAEKERKKERKKETQERKKERKTDTFLGD